MKQLTLIIVLASILTACTTTATSKAKVADLSISKQVCGIWSPLTYDGKLDTQQTKDQIKHNNAKRDAFCK